MKKAQALIRTKVQTKHKPGQDLSPSDWKHRLSEIYAEMHAKPTSKPGLTHAEAEDLMLLAFEAEQSEKNLTQSYPAFAQHLVRQ